MVPTRVHVRLLLKAAVLLNRVELVPSLYVEISVKVVAELPSSRKVVSPNLLVVEPSL